MNFDFIQQATSKELEQFKSVCNQLLSRTYVVRTLYRPGKGRVNNPDYTFLSLHFEAVQDYLGLLDWDLRKASRMAVSFLFRLQRFASSVLTT